LITILLILLLGLIFLGPQRMAHVAKKAGGYMAKYQQMQSEVRTHLQRELLDLHPPTRADAQLEQPKGDSI
jgi:Sec-independent protein translocase protein TatA